MSDTITYTPTAREWYAALWCVRRPLGRMAVQTAALLLLGIPPLIGLFFGFRDPAGWLMGVALPLLAVAQWIVPGISFWKEAAALAARPVTVSLTLTEQTLGCDGVTVPLEQADLQKWGDILLWRVDGEQTVLIPRRVLGEAPWARLTGGKK